MKNIVACLIFLLTFSIYLFTMVPSITDDDSGELSGVGVTLGVAHSPGYPLYSLTGKAMVTLIPWGNHAYRVNLVSAFFIALAGVVLYFVGWELSGNVLTAILISLMFCFSKSVWAMANVTEVYGLAAFVTCIICWILVNKQFSLQSYIFVAYLLGIGMTTHYILGLLIPGLVWWGITKIKSMNGSIIKYSVIAIIFGVLGFSVVLFLFFRAQIQPYFNWEDPSTLKRFWQVVARLRYGSLNLAQGGLPPLSLAVIQQKLLFFFQVLTENFTWAGMIIFVAGLWYCIKDKIKGWALILLLLGSGPGFLIMANVGLDDNSMELLRRFFFLTFIFVTVIIGVALSKTPRFVSGVSLIIPLVMCVQNFSSLNHRAEYIFYDYGKNILRTLPKNSILFSDRADEMEFAVAYLHTAERYRPDIKYTDCNAGVSVSIYGDDYYRIWGKPRLERRNQVEGEIIRNTNLPVYYATFLPKQTIIPKVTEGLLYRVPTINNPGSNYFAWDKIYVLREKFTQDSRGYDLLLTYYNILGTYFLSVSAPEKAKTMFTILKYENKKFKASTELAYWYFQRGEMNKSEQEFLEVLKDEPGRVDVLCNLGVIYEKRQQIDQAIDCYQKALKFDPNSEDANYNLAVAYWHKQEWNKVVDLFEKVLKLNPKHEGANRYLPFAMTKVKNSH